MIARVVFGLLLALVALAPLPFGSNRPWAWSLLALGTGALLAIWASAALVNPSLHSLAWRRYRPLALVFGPLFLWLLFQTVSWSPAPWHHPAWEAAAAALAEPLGGAISIAPDDSLGGVMRLIAYAAVFWLAMQLGRRGTRARAAWWTVSLAATCYALYGLAVQLGGGHTVLWFPKWSYYDSLTATFVNRNHFAVYAGFGLVATLALIVEQVQATARHGLRTRAGLIYFLDHMRLPLYALMVAFVILATALLLTHSRAGLACTGIGVMALLASFALGQPLRSRSLLVFGAIILAVALAILAFSGGAILSRMGDIVENSSARAQVYGLALQAIAERPLLGTGLGTFGAIFRLKRDATFGPGEPTYDVAHNGYLEMALEAGLPAALLFFAGFALIVIVLLRGARARRHNVVYPCTGLAASALAASHSLVDFSLQIPAIAVTYVLIAGIGYAQSWHSDE